MRRHRQAAASLCLALCALPVRAQVEIVSDVVYGHKDGMALTLDAFRPEAKSNGAGVMFMVSGGWYSRWSPPGRMGTLLAPLLDAGFVAFAVRHGSSPCYKVPDAAADVRLALDYVAANASDFGIDPRRIGAYGMSAGGHLSLLLGLEAAREQEPDRVPPAGLAAIVAFYPPVDLREMVGPSDRFPALDFPPSLAESVSPIAHVSRDDPPTLLIHGDRDTLVPISHSRRLYAALKEQAVISKLIVVEGAGHGFRGPDRRRSGRAMIEWFLEHLTSREVAQ